MIAHGETTPALKEASSIMKQRKEIENKQHLLDKFRDHFIMSDDEAAALTQTAEPVDKQFFDALNKSKKISQDCELLLGFENQTLGSELMEQTSKNINLGFQKLYKWIQREFKTLNLENPQMNASMRQALRVLAERPSLFQNCLDFFAEARERILSDSFYAALTGTSASGVEDRSVKPIDMAAHDPLRYVGDMLAWVHSAMVSEREALEVLFVAEGDELAKGLRTGRDAEVWRLVADEQDEISDFNALRALHDLVDRDISGASRILRQRVEQVIQTNEEIVPAYKLANLISFYHVTFDKLLGKDSNLLESMIGLQTEAMRQFKGLVRDRIATLQAEFQQPPSDLAPPNFLQESLDQVRAFVQTYDTSLTSAEDRESGFEDVLIETFDPFIAGCENIAKSMDSPGGFVFLLNCRLCAISALGLHDFTSSRLKPLQENKDAESQKLVENQHRFFREESGLDSIIKSLEERKDEILDAGQLRQASQALDNFLPSALMDAVDRLKHLQESSLARKITAEAAEKFCTDFENLEDAVIEADDGSEDEPGSIRSAFPRTTAEIRVLLS